MIRLRNLGSDDVVTIARWPPYPPEFADLDYALRTEGWLAEYLCRPDTWLFAAEKAGEIIAFSILSKTGIAEAEFRIAVHIDHLGQGVGGAVASMTLRKGFTEFDLARIHLIVRKNNSRAIRLYRRLGFAEYGECRKRLNGKRVRFLEMHLLKRSFVTE